MRRYPPVGWRPSRFLADRAEAERALQLAERLGCVNAAAQELGTTWPSMRKAFTGTGSACPRATPKRSDSARSILRRRPPAGRLEGVGEAVTSPSARQLRGSERSAD